MKDIAELTYGIVGLGLMGGSIGKAIRQRVLAQAGAGGRIYGLDANAASRDLAIQQHTCDRVFPPAEADAMLADCDLVYVCLYPHATVDFLRAHRAAFKSGAIVSDISGVKSLIVGQLAGGIRNDVDFIPGHPMAGGEREGYASSSGDIFTGRNYILMPTDRTRPENLELFKQLVSALGCTRIVETDARVHDHKIAFTSQLCHVIASALVDSAEDTQITAFGGGSFEDLTRIAMINAPLWTELFLANKAELLAHISTFERSLTALKTAIQDDDAPAIQSYLENVRSRRLAMARTDVRLER